VAKIGSFKRADQLGTFTHKNDDTNFVLELSARKFESDSIEGNTFFILNSSIQFKIRDTFLI
jgi:hypothetical protein